MTQSERLNAIADYIAEQFAAALDLTARDFDVDFDDEIITVCLMTDDEPEREYTFECSSDDDCYTFTSDEHPSVTFALHPPALRD